MDDNVLHLVRHVLDNVFRGGVVQPKVDGVVGVKCSVGFEVLDVFLGQGRCDPDEVKFVGNDVADFGRGFLGKITV